MKIKYNATESFKKDLKKLLKRFKTLKSDLEAAKKHAIANFHLKNVDNRSIVQIPKIGAQTVRIYKIVKFSCKSLKGRGAKSGIRITYAYHNDDEKIVFLEIYFKGDKENEDSGRINDYFG